MVGTAIQLRGIAELDELSVHPGPDEPLLQGFVEQLPELAFAALDERGEDLYPQIVGPRGDLLGDLRRRLAAHGRPHEGQCGVPTRAQSSLR